MFLIIGTGKTELQQFFKILLLNKVISSMSTKVRDDVKQIRDKPVKEVG